MAAADILKNPKIVIYGNGLTDRHNIWHDGAYWAYKPDKQLKFRTFKKSTTANLKNGII